jgi:hypothetical protein
MAGIILVILIFSFLVFPKHGELSDSKRKYSLAKNAVLKQEEKLEALKSLPSFNVVLSPKSDTVLAIIKLFEKQNYQVSNFTEGSDKIGRYVSFLVTINDYSSLADVINHLNAISQILPVKYIGYEIDDTTIKVKALCYII